jgi:hypothetical protein
MKNWTKKKVNNTTNCPKPTTMCNEEGPRNTKK